jgi:hypothetical protein
MSAGAAALRSHYDTACVVIPNWRARAAPTPRESRACLKKGCISFHEEISDVGTTRG